VADTVTYYAVVGGGRSVEDPSGLARRRQLEAGGIADESLRRDLTWGPTSAIAEWKRDAMDFNLVELSTDQAQALIERFREKWAQQDS
jgi:hypothetical protein